MTTAEDRRIRALRPPKAVVDPWRPIGLSVEDERTPGGTVRRAFTVFLAGAECPFTCSFCDLWRHTLDGPTPAGALPAQLHHALIQWAGEPLAGAAVKLYNASNFFDPRAVPDADVEEIVALVEPFSRVVVESHPRLLGPRARALAGRLDGRLEVAMGLETVHPRAVSRLNKRSTPADFDRAAAELRRDGTAVRAFVLLGAPFVAAEEDVEWTLRSVEFALDRGAQVVALIPLRAGNGEIDRLVALGEAVPPTLDRLEAAFERALGLGRGVILADLWDAGRLATCPRCGPERLARLGRMNLSGEIESKVACPACREGSEERGR